MVQLQSELLAFIPSIFFNFRFASISMPSHLASIHIPALSMILSHHLTILTSLPLMPLLSQTLFLRRLPYLDLGC
jgi:hypothetical protein